MKKRISSLLVLCLLLTLLFPMPPQVHAAEKEPLTRGMALQLLYEQAGGPVPTEAAPFSDRSGSNEAAIDWAYAQGLLKGYPDGTCRPGEQVTREQFLTMVYRQDGMAVIGDLSGWDGRTELSDWAKDALFWSAAAGLLPRPGGQLGARQTLNQTEALGICARAKALPDITGLRADLEALTADRRPAASSGESAAVEHLSRRFADLGYDVTLQPCTAEGEPQGANVIAVKASGENSDILVISAHHDSVPSSFGGNDNASGVAALLMVAEQLTQTESDTELRFISFTDEENGKNGSRRYVESLSAEERARMVGCIQLDMLGGLGSGEAMLYTTDGKANWLCDLLCVQQPDLLLGTETASDHASFQLAGVPSVLISQKNRGYLYHTVGDTADMLDLYRIHRAADLVRAAVQTVLSYRTGSYQELARQQAEGYLYQQHRSSYILFSGSRQENEAMIGLSGTLVDRWEDIGEFWHDVYETYRYDMVWFGGDKPMITHYIYRNDYLEQVEIYPADSGYTARQVYDLMCDLYGRPADADPGNNSGNWEDIVYSKYFSLDERDGLPVVSVYPYSMGMGNILASYEVQDGNALIDDSAHRAVWDLYCSVLPIEHRKKIGAFQLFTDGYSGALAYTAAMEGETGYDNSRFSVSVDYYDVYDENGAPRDHSKLLYTLIHEYGHVRLEDDTQIDLTVSADVHDSAGFIPGSFRKQFYDAFWQDDYSSYLGSYYENPECYVSEYSAYAFYEDIAETFAVFVFSGKPEGDSVAQQKIGLFWSDADMVSLRADIRAGLGLN